MSRLRKLYIAGIKKELEKWRRETDAEMYQSLISMNEEGKMQNKFYVAASRIQDGFHGSNWRKPSLDAAVKHAQELMEQDGSQEKYIVKVVAVVKREKPPIRVERVR